MLNPWVFGDEYIYISKARNLSYGIDVISDASLGHTYPPLYSYAITPAISDTAAQSYTNIQFSNVAMSLLLFFLAFFILNKVFQFTKTKLGIIFMGMAFMMTVTLPAVSGYWLVAMSENLYIPIIALIFSSFVYLAGRYDNIKPTLRWWWLAGLGLLTTSAILTRSIGLAVLPALGMSISWLFWKNTIDTKALIKKLGLSLILTLGLALIGVSIFNTFEQSFIQQTAQAIEQHSYSSNSYLKVITDLFKGQNNLTASMKIIGNHAIYLLLASYLLPIVFYLDELIKLIKFKKISKLSAEFVFLSSFIIFSWGLSYLHTYLGFRSNPIKYSTYFRYMDPTVVMLFLYGVVRFWQVLREKIELEKVTLIGAGIISAFLIIMLPARDFYISINSLGWGWLDLLKNQPQMIKPVLLVLVIVMLVVLQYKRNILLGMGAIILIINALTARVGYLDMHRWQAGIYRDNVDAIVNELVYEQGITQFYLDKPVTSDHSYLYYLKWRLLFENRELVPMPIVDWERDQQELLAATTPFAVISETSESELVENATIEAPATYQIEDKWQVRVYNQ